MVARLEENDRSIPVIVQRARSPLGSWTRASYRPEGELARHVEAVVALRGGYLPREVRSLAKPAAELFIDLREGSRGVSSDGAWIAGVRERPVLLPSDGVVDFLVVRFRVTGAWTLLGCRGDEIANRIVSASDLEDSFARELRDRIGRARELPSRVRIAVAALTGRLSRARRPDPVVVEALSGYVLGAGRGSVSGLCADLGVSRRRLVEGFRQEVGITPKRYAGLVRFHDALERVIGRGGPLAAIAVDCGFADQAHMTGEFRRLAADPPGRLRSAAFSRIDRFRFGLLTASPLCKTLGASFAKTEDVDP